MLKIGVRLLLSRFLQGHRGAQYRGAIAYFVNTMLPFPRGLVLLRFPQLYTINFSRVGEAAKASFLYTED